MRIQEKKRCTVTVSQLIAEWVKANHYESISGEVGDIAKRSILDFAGAALAGSRQTIAQTVEKVKDPEITALMPKVKLTPAPEMQTDDEATLPATVESKLKDGRRVAKRCDY
ncbi:MAG: hypothetical protein JSW15_07200, partial [Deltaproteobacteria bacterium]